MRKIIRFGVGGLIIASVIGGAGLWYINHKANLAAGDMLTEAAAYVDQNLDGFSLSYGDYSANGLTRSLTISDVALTSDDGDSLTMDQITISADDDSIHVIDAFQISLTEKGESLGTIGALEIRNAAILKTDLRALAIDPMRLAQSLVIDRIILKDTEFRKDGDSLRFSRFELTDIKDASMGISVEDLMAESYGDTISVSALSVDRMDILPLMLWNEDAMIRDQLGISEFEIKNLKATSATGTIETKLIAVSDIRRDRGMLTSIDIVIDDMISTSDLMNRPEIEAIMMTTGIDNVVVDLLMNYEVSLEKETVSMTYGMDVADLGKLDISGLVTGMDKQTYEMIFANASGDIPQTMLTRTSLALDHFDLIYTDDMLADIMLDAYSGGNRDALAENVSSSILFYGMLSQQLDFVQPLAAATSDFIRGGNRFAISLKAKAPLNQGTAVEAMRDGTISDFVTLMASGS